MIIDKDKNYCKICFENKINLNNLHYKFICNHKFYCNDCIDKWILKNNSCPYCRAISINNNEKRILVWNKFQITAATLYKKHNNLNYEISIIKSINEKKEGDIIFHNF